MLTIAQVLAMPVLRNADPEVLAGHERLHRSVRWVHTTELHDIGLLLRGGDLVLTTGIAMPDNPQILERFATSLWESDTTGLILELGRRWSVAPPSLVDACRRLGLPLIVLHREVRFASVAQQIGERIVDEQLVQLREAQQVHDVFTDLSVSEATPKEILQAVGSLAGASVAVETGHHQVLDFRAGPTGAAAFLDDWERRSRAVRLGERTGWDESNGWLVTQIGRPERGWGRLVIESAAEPSPRLVAVAERGAAALALERLHDRQRDSQVRRVHHELIVELLTDSRSRRSPRDDLRQRCELAGLPVERRTLVGLALRGRPASSSLAGPAASASASASAGSASAGLAEAADELIAPVLHAAALAKLPCLAAVVDDDLRVLLSLPRRASAPRLVDELVAATAKRHRLIAASGQEVSDFADAGRTLREALQVLQSVPAAPGDSAGVVTHRLQDVHVRGLLRLLADDDRLAAFADRELSRLRAADTHDRLVPAVRAFVEHPTKAAAASALAVSRPVFYERLAAAEQILGLSLDDPVIRTSLHLALLIEDL